MIFVKLSCVVVSLFVMCLKCQEIEISEVRSSTIADNKVGDLPPATEMSPTSVEICSVRACGEIRSNGEGSDMVLNIQCSELDYVKGIPDLNRLEWPPNLNGLKMFVTFEGITTVESLPSNSLLESLKFSNNQIKSIWPGAFSDLPNLRRLSFTQTELTKITPDMFTKLHALEELDMSYNNLTVFNELDFAELKSLKKLILLSNRLTKVPVEALDKNSKLEDLDLNNNAIVNLAFKSESSILKTVKRINLSGNNIISISANTFPENAIELLDLSNNAISTIEDSAFSQCTHLRELNLASNQIASPFSIPVSVLSVTLAHNRLRDWPTFPATIRHVDMSYNRLHQLYDQNYVDFEELEILKLSGNELTTFELTTRLPKIITLDVSYNALQDIPANLNSAMLPELAELRLDGNSFNSIYFPDKISLRTLHLSDLRELRFLGDGAVSNVMSRRETGTECIQLYITNCPELEAIGENAFNGTPICLLDLSYNNLTQLPRDLVDWSSLKEGLNLQGNPWNCSCPMQWMLDTLLPRIHQNYPHFLNELRCEFPRARQGLRMVHWLNWGERVLCSNGYSYQPNQSYRLEPLDSTTVLPGVSNFSLALGGCIVLALLVVVALSAYLIKTRNRSFRIRAATKRRRQNATDRAANGKEEQFKALNKA